MCKQTKSIENRTHEHKLSNHLDLVREGVYHLEDLTQSLKDSVNTKREEIKNLTQKIEEFQKECENLKQTNKGLQEILEDKDIKISNLHNQIKQAEFEELNKMTPEKQSAFDLLTQVLKTDKDPKYAIGYAFKVKKQMKILFAVAAAVIYCCC